MTKTLTEQWKNGELDYGYYYLQTKDGERRIDRTTCDIGSSIYLWTQTDKNYIQEVLAPVPSYDEIKRLQEQLKEANDVIDACCSLPETNWVVIDYYKEKWGVK